MIRERIIYVAYELFLLGNLNSFGGKQVLHRHSCEIIINNNVVRIYCIKINSCIVIFLFSGFFFKH